MKVDLPFAPGDFVRHDLSGIAAEVEAVIADKRLADLDREIGKLRRRLR
jgi:hypothetical protein